MFYRDLKPQGVAECPGRRGGGGGGLPHGTDGDARQKF